MSCSCAEGGGESPEEKLSVRLAVGGEEPQGRRLGLVGVAGAAGAPALKRSQMSARARLGRGAARCGVSAAQRGGGGGGGGGGGRARHAPARRASSLSRRRATVFCRAACSARLDRVTGPGVRGMVGMRKAGQSVGRAVGGVPSSSPTEGVTETSVRSSLHGGGCRVKDGSMVEGCRVEA